MKVGLERATGITQLDDKTKLRDMLLHIALDNFAENTVLWRIGDSDLFKVSSTYQYLIDGGSRLPHAKLIWRSKGPLKACIFLWFLAKDAILSWQNLQRRGWLGSSYCIQCKGHSEDGHHLFLECPCSVKVWTCACRFRLCVDKSRDDSFWTSIHGHREQRDIVGLVVAGICWNILREGNNRIFNNT